MVDDNQELFDRADAFINLANEKLTEVSPGQVSAALNYASARFCAWLSASGFATAEEMTASREETIAYFVEAFRGSLEIHMDEYIDNFSQYMERASQSDQP